MCNGHASLTLPSCSNTTFMTPSGRLRWTIVSRAGRCVSLLTMPLRARRAFPRSSSPPRSFASASARGSSAPASATHLAWSGVWRPICTKSRKHKEQALHHNMENRSCAPRMYCSIPVHIPPGVEIQMPFTHLPNGPSRCSPHVLFRLIL